MRQRLEEQLELPLGVRDAASPALRRIVLVCLAVVVGLGLWLWL